MSEPFLFISVLAPHLNAKKKPRTAAPAHSIARFLSLAPFVVDILTVPEINSLRNCAAKAKAVESNPFWDCSEEQSGLNL
jgi:hypothetical protein